MPIILTLAFITFITNNPGFAAWLIAGLFTIIGGLILAYWTMIASRLSKLEETDAKLGDRVAGVEQTLKGYEEHVGAGDKLFKTLMDRVERHMTEEEDQVWSGINKLSDKLIQIHEDNLSAHALITERLTRVEAKMPNGELGKLASVVDQIAKKVGV